ncbi:RNA polymerase-associated protein rtf1 [Allomyces arbusculus]|nr:RNA polymerase-associated protein rtf1 [Allomyces arbusculus]
MAYQYSDDDPALNDEILALVGGGPTAAVGTDGNIMGAEPLSSSSSPLPASPDTNARSRKRKRARAPAGSDDDDRARGSDSDGYRDSTWSGAAGRYDEATIDQWAADRMGDDEDRRRLDALPELEREKILAEREDQLDRLKEKRLLQEKLRESQRLSSENTRRTDKAKLETKRKLEALKDKREEKRKSEKSRSRRALSDDDDSDGEYRDRSDRGHRGRVAASSDYDDDEYRDDNDDRYRRPSSTSQSSRRPTTSDRHRRDLSPPSPPAAKRRHVPASVTYSDLRRIQLTRDEIEKWCYASFFEDLATDIFVRLRVGNNKQGQPQYRVAQIKEIVTYKRVYLIQRVKTNKAFILKHGKAESQFLGDVVSNSPFTEAEFNRWKITCEHEGVDLPTQDFAADKAAALAKASAHVFSDKEIGDMIKQKRELAAAPRNLALEKADLLRQRTVALSAGNHDEVARLNDQLESIQALADSQNHDLRPARAVRAAEANTRQNFGRYGARQEVVSFRTAAAAAGNVDMAAILAGTSAAVGAGDDATDAKVSIKDLWAAGPKLDLEL